MGPLGGEEREMRVSGKGNPDILGESSGAPFVGLLCDGRWRGSHGIGRFATEALSRLPGARILEGGAGVFLSPLDPFWIDFRIAGERPRAYFTPGFNPPFFAKVPLVLTLHDLIHLKDPREGGRLKGLYYEHVIKPALKRAVRVLTVSEFSKGEILSWAKIPEERIAVVGNGVSPAFFPEGPVYLPGFPYFLYVGNRKPHKNLPLLFRALSRSRLPEEFRLLLVGGPDPQTDREIRRWRVENRVVYAGSVEEKDLPSVYRGASALLFPSRLEGFGLPVLEAMACGCPVLSSRIPAVEEVAGETVVYFSPEDPDSWAGGLEMIARGGSPEIDARKKEASKRARLFSWERVGERLRRILQSAMEEASR